jgi:hypothetical protein
MRIALVLPRTAAAVGGDPAAYVASASHHLIQAGHQLAVVGALDSADRALSVPAGVTLTPIAPQDSGRRYFTADHAYSDGVLGALQELSRLERLDAVEFVGGNGIAGFTPIRAKRLLGELTGTRLVVRLCGRRPPQHGMDQPTSIEEAIRAYMESYCIRYADAALARVRRSGASLHPSRRHSTRSDAPGASRHAGLSSRRRCIHGTASTSSLRPSSSSSGLTPHSCSR